MAFKKIVVVGGGPIGLFCAIDAAETFKSMSSKVSVVEMRQDYSRMNVPTLHNEIHKHLQHLGIKDKALGKSGIAPLAQLEKALYEKAKGSGVKLRSGYVVTDVTGLKKRKDGRFKDMNVTIRQWDHAKKIPTGKQDVLSCDLLIVAIGSGGVESGQQFGKIFEETLGFTQKKLKAATFAAYGVYQKNRLDDAVSVQSATKQVFGGISFETDTSHYLLVTLKDISPSDFQKLKSDAAELKKCMTTLGQAYKNNVLNKLDDNAKAVGAFEVRIKRAGHVISPRYPAVLVGDSAVSPHPSQGTGLLTGFHGFEALQDLFKALKNTNRSSDEAADALFAFEDAYEIWVSAKAIEGTIVTLKFLDEMMERYEMGNRRNQATVQSPKAKAMLMLDEMLADFIRKDLKSELNRAKWFAQLLAEDTARLDKAAGRNVRSQDGLSAQFQDLKREDGFTPGHSDSLDKLWGDIAKTYDDIEKILKDYTAIDNALRELETKLRLAQQPRVGVTV